MDGTFWSVEYLALPSTRPARPSASLLGPNLAFFAGGMSASTIRYEAPNLNQRGCGRGAIDKWSRPGFQALNVGCR